MANSCEYYSYDFGNTCSVTGEKKPISEEYYRRYCYAYYNKRDCPLHKKYGPYISSGCFITTVVCDVLGNPDDGKVMNTFRRFREDVLKKDSKYYEGLDDYDNIGPILACRLVDDKDCKDMADMIYEIDLLNVYNFCLEKKYDDAYNWYVNMTKDLISYYGLDDTYEAFKNGDYECSRNFDPSLAGHGFSRKKIRNLC